MSLKQGLKIGGNIAFLAVFIVLFKQFSSVEEITNTLRLLEWPFVVAGLTALSLTYVLRTHRFYILLPKQTLPWFVVFKVMLQHNAINNVLPFRLGELSFPILLKKHANLNLTTSAKVLITARLYDLLIMGAIAAFVLNAVLQIIAWPWFFMLIVAFTLFALFLLKLIQLSQRPLAEKLTNYFSYMLNSAVPTSIVSLLIWALKLAGLSLLLTPMLKTQWLYSLVGVLVIEGTAILPINGPANFGSLEGAVVAALSPFNLSPDVIFTAVLNLHFAIIMLAALGYLISFFIPNANLRPHS